MYIHSRTSITFSSYFCLKQNPQVRSCLQKFADEAARGLKLYAPVAFSNLIQGSQTGAECRLGTEMDITERPFTGLTCVLDYAAHFHKDTNNVPHGATCVRN